MGSLGLLVLLVTPRAAMAAPPPRERPAAVASVDPVQQLEQLAQGFYAEQRRAHPRWATELGFHDHDGELDDYSPGALAAQRAGLQRWQRQLADFAARAGEALPAPSRIDLKLLSLGVQARRLELERVQGHRHRAGFYPELASSSIYVLIERDFAPEAERLRSVIERERRIPALLAQGQKNLAEVPRSSIEILRLQLPGIIDFFATDVPRAFPHALAGPARAQFERANAAVVAALKAYGQQVDKRIAPRARAQFALGEALLRDKLAAEEMIDAPVEALLAEGEGELGRLREQFEQTARLIADKASAKAGPRLSVAQVLRVMSSDYPPPDKLIASVQARLGGLRYFLQQHHIVTVPSEVMPRVEETPPFLRSTSTASMYTPGPYETRATDAMLNVTLPERGWPPQRVRDFMSGAFHRALIDTTAIHEAFPGHYVQFLWMQRLRSTVRRHEVAGAYAEGWAHYCEQMMLDEGWGDGDDKLRLAQLQDALLRAGRYVAALRMHARGMTVEQAVALFRDQAYQGQEVAEVEARRGTEDPTYLIYTWGKLRLLELRQAYRQRQGASFSLQRFHDAVLAEGPLPLPLLRAALVGP